MLTTHEYNELKTRLAIYDAWAKQYQQKNGWTVIPSEAVPPVEVTNDDRAAIEVYEFVSMPPDRYFLYLTDSKPFAHTWTGEPLSKGYVVMGRPWKDNFGGERVAIRFKGINGLTYAGTWFKSSGDYARVKAVKGGK